MRAVDGVSFTLFKGETLGIVGESGCGKSTLARLLLHLVDRDAGELIFDGEPVGAPRGITVAALAPSRADGVPGQLLLAQSAHAGAGFRRLRPVRARPRASPTRAAIARDMLVKVGLNPDLFGPRYPHELSGGQKQRVNIARALAIEPRMVILDEAVSALDKSVEAQVLNLLRALKQQFNLTYLFISHDLNVVRYISDRVLVMYLGRVVELGPAEEIFTRPLHPYTRALLRFAPVDGSRAPHRGAADHRRSAQSDRSAQSAAASAPAARSPRRCARTKSPELGAGASAIPMSPPAICCDSGSGQLQRPWAAAEMAAALSKSTT